MAKQYKQYDEDFKKATREVFSDGIDDYFTKEDYGYSYLEMIMNDETTNDYDSFGDIKKYLIKETLLDDNFIEVETCDDSNPLNNYANNFKFFVE